MADALSVMLSIVRARLNDSRREWLDAALATARDQDVNRLCAAYTAAWRKAGPAPLSVTSVERATLSAVAPDLTCERWTLADATRAAIVLAAAEATDINSFATRAVACFENGDAGEQQSWLRSLILLPRSDRFTSVAVDACRSHIQPLFESIACENPYPSTYFSDRQFNQIVLKALFTGVQLERIVGLARRLNADLSRMARDYAEERRAAGRTVPADLALALHDAPELEGHLS
jgi:hypothetical protein